ncbi:MAG: exonuclease subunit SbcD [Chloroflexi bacterium]|nr:exonuclease subunit SbcD [Chloroflexota bacterium]
MVRIIHLADLHLGIDRYGSPNPETGLSFQMEDFLRALDETVDYAIDWGASLFLFCGDAYKSRDPSQTQQREFAKRIARLVKNRVAVFLLVGNHDLPHARGLANSLDIFPTLGVGNVAVGSSAGTHTIETRDGPVQVVALPWATRSNLVAGEDFRLNSIEGINKVIEQKLTEIIKAEASALAPVRLADSRNGAAPAILAGHLTHSLATLSTERGLYLSQDYILPVGALNDPAFDYVALGHIHKTQKVEMAVPIVYAGSLQRMDFSEEGQDKGFYALELDPGKEKGNRLLSFEFRPVKARRFLTIEVKIQAGDNDPTAAVLREIERKNELLSDAIVRVRVHLPADAGSDLRDGEIRKALKEARQVAGISKEIESLSRPRLSGLTPEGLAPMAALREYMKVNNVGADRQKVLLEYAGRLISGEQ